MLELIVTVVITLSSVLMFGYWFRYTCLLILSATTTRDYAVDVATANPIELPASPDAIALKTRAISISSKLRSIMTCR